MFKKVTLAVLGLVANVTSAGTMGAACIPGHVTVPCDAKLWDFSAQALYLKSVYGNDKAFEPGVLAANKEIKNNWDWGYRLEGAYHFNTGNDIRINWMHLSSSIDPTSFLGILRIPAINLTSLTVPFELTSFNRIDQVNILMGQYTNLGLRDKIRISAGLQYANIQSTATSYYITAQTPVPSLADNPLSKFNNTDYKGFGPAVSLDYAYSITDALSITANGGGSILYGTSRYHGGFVMAPFDVILEQRSLRKKSIVPSLEAKLGVNYAHVTPVGVANIQVGYQVINYFNVLETQSLANLVGPLRSVDYGVFGPYFGLKLIGDA